MTRLVTVPAVLCEDGSLRIGTIDPDGTVTIYDDAGVATFRNTTELRRCYDEMIDEARNDALYLAYGGPVIGRGWVKDAKRCRAEIELLAEALDHIESEEDTDQ